MVGEHSSRSTDQVDEIGAAGDRWRNKDKEASLKLGVSVNGTDIQGGKEAVILVGE